MSDLTAVLFTGCKPEVAAFDGKIIGVGPGARQAAGRSAEVVRLAGEAWPGLIDSHIHLEGLADKKLTVDLTGTRTLAETLARVKEWAKDLPKGAWVVGSGWYNDAWPDPAFPTREQLDRVVGGRPTYLRRKDGHSAWVSTQALNAAGVDRATEDPAGGTIDHDALGETTGILRETAMLLVWRHVPPPSDADLDRAMAKALNELARFGLTGVHSMDGARGFSSLQRIASHSSLPVRVTYNLPLADLPHAERMGVRSGWGDASLRIWGVKAFLDGSLGSRTAEMLDGSGVVRLAQDELVDMIERCARAQLNVCLHAIGDGAVRRAIDALAQHRNAWSHWRPRIEHAQCVHPKDMPRMAKAGIIASMQPIHAVSDREIADAMWANVVQNAYAWRALEKAGVRLAFGSDAPVETADPIAGIEAATTWRREAKWHPELALTRASALRAYTSGAAYSAGMEKEAGALRAGRLCDMTVVDGGRVIATVAGGRVTWRRKPS
ncbi:MAG TPA: amidohydrolase [Candidatus Dormibacteraeota bacterium]|nr:amidohydrolase [Candidatus Dormibacteraeota bacterium]